MIIKLLNYCAGYKIVSLSKSHDVTTDLLSNNLEVLFFDGKHLFISPSNLSYEISSGDIEKLNIANDYDVFEIHPNGQAFQLFNNSSPDNGIIVTDKCSSNCIMCPVSEGIRKNGKAKDINSLLEIAKHIPVNTEHLTITGGEPFLLGKDIFEFFEYLKENLPYTRFQLLTNGRAFAIDEYAELLFESSPKHLKICIPLHGYNSITHDAITQTNGSFEQTALGLRNLLSLGFSIELRIVVSKLNIEFMNEISEYIVKNLYGIKCVKFIGLEMLGNAAKNVEKVWIPYDKAFLNIKNSIDYIVMHGIDVGLYNFPLCAVGKKYWSICQKSITDYKITYADECNSCSVKDACGGIFAGTIRLAKNDVKRISTL